MLVPISTELAILKFDLSIFTKNCKKELNYFVKQNEQKYNYESFPARYVHNDCVRNNCFNDNFDKIFQSEIHP